METALAMPHPAATHPRAFLPGVTYCYAGIYEG